MKIECILRRKGGSHIEMPGKKYHFEPQEDGRHIAEVEDDGHIERFLAIPEAYRIARAPGASAVESNATASLRASATKLPDNPPAMSVDASQLKVPGATFPPSFEIGGKTYSLIDVAMRAFQDSGLTLENWNDLDDDAREAKVEIVLDALEDGEITIDTAADEQPDERVKLSQQYQAMFGRLPPGNMKIETLKAKLATGAE